MELSFIVIDDTELDHFIAQKMIINANNTFSIKNFFDANIALEYILKDDCDTDIKVILVFLDIYMPLMDGFQFIEEFEKLDPVIQDKYYIVALTSSRERSDINRINSYKSFKAMINKPVTSTELSVLLNNITRKFDLKLQ